MKRMALVLVASSAFALGTKLLSNHLAHAGHRTPTEVQQAADEEFRARGFAEFASRLSRERGVSTFACESRFTLPLSHGRLEGDPPSPLERERAERVIQDELTRYSASALSAAHLARVVIVSHLTEGGKPIPSLPNCDHAMFVDATLEERAMRRVVHHEFFHFIDFAEDGEVGNDPNWEALNAFQFTYLGSGRDVRTPEAAFPSSALPGFINRYATASQAEDRAELFSYMMMDPELVRARASTDSVLANKTLALKKYIP